MTNIPSLDTESHIELTEFTTNIGKYRYKESHTNWHLCFHRMLNTTYFVTLL